MSFSWSLLSPERRFFEKFVSKCGGNRLLLVRSIKYHFQRLLSDCVNLITKCTIQEFTYKKYLRKGSKHFSKNIYFFSDHVFWKRRKATYTLYYCAIHNVELYTFCKFSKHSTFTRLFWQYNILYIFAFHF